MGSANGYGYHSGIDSYHNHPETKGIFKDGCIFGNAELKF